MRNRSAAKNIILSSNFTLSFISMLSATMVMYMLMTTVAEYSSGFSGSIVISGLIAGIYIIGGVFSRMIVSPLMGRIGWKPFAVLAVGFQALTCLFYYFANSTLPFLVIRFVHGFCGGAFGNAVMSLATTTFPKSRYAEANGIFMLSSTLAVGVGPFLGGFIYNNFGGNGCFFCAILLSLMGFVCMLMFDDRDLRKGGIGVAKAGGNEAVSVKDDGGYRGIEKLIDIRALPIGCCALLHAFSYSALVSFYRLYAEEQDLVKQFSVMFIIYSIVLVFSRPAAGKIQDKYGDDLLCSVGAVTQFIGLLAIALRPCMVTIVICAICCALGYGTLNSVCNAIACRACPADRRSHAVAAFWICCDIGMGGGPVVLGMIQRDAGFSNMYICAAVTALISLPMYLFFARKKSSPPKQRLTL